MSMCCGITWRNQKKEWFLTTPKVSVKNQASSPNNISCSLIKQIASHGFIPTMCIMYQNTMWKVCMAKSLESNS
jgi:hypothetical protein